MGPRIKRLRNAKRMTADALARSCGITENAVRKLESGDSKEPRFTTGLKIASTLGVNPQTLIDGRSRPSSAQAVTDLASVIQRIRGARSRLEGMRVAHVAVFGSVARGEAKAGSDVDIMVEPADTTGLSLVELGAVSEMLEDIVEARVDVLTAGTVRMSRFKCEVEKEAVVAF